jgi:hypothetical protein
MSLNSRAIVGMATKRVQHRKPVIRALNALHRETGVGVARPS